MRRRPPPPTNWLIVVPALLLVGLVSACSATSPADATAVASSSVAAALSSAAQASPGEYGVPVDPSLPNPTEVASDSPVSTPTGPETPVVLTFADWNAASGSLQVGAYVPGAVEDGGTCTLTATGHAGPVSISAPAEADAASTTCPGLVLPGSELSPGSWQVTVTYRSSTTSGLSEPSTVEVL